MIDLHSHVLPGVDDGAQNLEDSLEMIRKAISQGITHLMYAPSQQRKVSQSSRQDHSTGGSFTKRN